VSDVHPCYIYLLHMHPTGNKSLFQNGLSRMEAFNEWVFEREEDTIIGMSMSVDDVCVCVCVCK
jgi:hypothetical protein